MHNALQNQLKWIWRATNEVGQKNLCTVIPIARAIHAKNDLACHQKLKTINQPHIPRDKLGLKFEGCVLFALETCMSITKTRQDYKHVIYKQEVVISYTLY